ncbi:TonB-dependent receptor [Microbulbifer bruguierae]|uniref:TonB-dependent receptor n=1 Tax=Microbulbifer bruguierae TaxID=3029061 RepID=A0ABY8NEH9_9GAMM|nr:TonB-dependent receptor [Microbulbifer bruguierae]WGL16834.1 TonB-dependent receptor [Microbulbifer bruguierae]
MYRKPLTLAVASAIFSSGTLVTPVYAQDSKADHNKNVTALRGENFAIEEVVVTARKREETLDTVPVAIDVLGSQALMEKGISTLDDVARYTPGLNFQTGLMPNDTRISLRGFSSTRGRSNVAILVDGIDISSESMTSAGGGIGPNLSLMDLERVEVVKGPQSALYGRSAFSGAVNYVTKRPGDAGETSVSVDANDQGFAKLQVAANVPMISDVLAGSINLAKTEFDGYYKNPNTGGDLGGTESEGIATALFWTPTESFSAYWRGEYSEEHYSPRAIVERESLVNTGSAPGDFALLGSVGENTVMVPVPGRGATAADCATATPYGYMIGMPVACAPIFSGNVGGASESEIDLSADPLTGKDFAGTQVRSVRTTLELAWNTESFDLVSLTGINYNDSRVQEDFDRTDYALQSLGPGTGAYISHPFDPTYFPGYPGEYTQYGVNSNSDTTFDGEQFSQEFRLSGASEKLDWQVSALYWRETLDTVMNQKWWLREGVDKAFWDAYLDSYFGGMGMVDHRTSPVDLPIPMSRETEHLSAAFALNYNITESVRASLEGRYLQEDIDYRSVPLSTQFNGLMGVPYFDPVTFMPGEPQEQTYARTDTAFVPRASIDWQVSDDTMVYASAAEGFKPGGMTTTDGNGDISIGEYDPEELVVYEVGYKGSMLDNRLQLTASAFLYDYTDQQISYFVADVNTGAQNAAVTNVGESSLKGVELGVVYRPSSNWTFVTSYTGVKSRFDDFRIADVGNPGTLDKLWTGTEDGDYTGNQFINSPETSALASIRYDGEFANGAGYFTELLANYESKRYLDRGNNAYLPAYTLVDFQGGVSWQDLDVVLYINNLLDDDKVKSGINNVGYGHLPAGAFTAQVVDLILPNPRTVGLRASYSF